LRSGGGSGRCYDAEHVRVGRGVALKTLRPEFVENRLVLRRFFDEARAVNRISHHNIVQLTDIVEDPRIGSYLVMELLSGCDLNTLLGRETVLSIPRAV